MKKRPSRHQRKIPPLKSTLSMVRGAPHGAALVEMGMLVGLVAVVAIGAVTMTGHEVSETFCKSSTAMANAMDSENSLECSPEGRITQAGPITEFPSGIDANGFSDLILAAGTTGLQTVMVNASEPLSAPATLAVSPGAGTVLACFQEVPEGEVACAAFNGSTSTAAVPAGASAYGYRIAPPDEVRAPYSQELAISLSDGSDDLAWNVTTSREAVPMRHSPDMDFRDKVFASGATGIQTVMLPLEGEFNGALDFTTNGGVARFAPCIQSEAGGDPICAEMSDGFGAIDVPLTTHSVGYAVELPSDPTADFSDSVALTLRSDYRPEVATPWQISVGRVPEGVVISDSIAFNDVILPAETTSLYTHLVEMTGYSNTPMKLSISTTESITRACYRAQMGGPLTCGNQSSTTSIEVPADAYEIGLSSYTTSSKWSTSSKDYAIELASVSDASVSRSWNINISKPAAKAEMNASFSFESRDFPVGTADEDHYVMETVAGSSFNVTGTLKSTRTNASMPLAICTQEVENGPIFCAGSGNWTSSRPFHEDLYAVGYRVSFPGNAPLSEAKDTVKIELIADGANETLEWNPTLRRPAGTPIVEASYVLSDRTAEYGEKIMFEKTGNFNDQMFLKVASSPGIYLHACVQHVENGDITCGNRGRPASSISADEDTFAIGFMPQWNYYGAGWTFNNQITFELQSKSDPAVKDVQSFQFTRN